MGHAVQPEDHLLEEIAGVIWRKRRLRLAEAGSYWTNVDKATDFSSITFNKQRVGPILEALVTTPAETAKDIVEVQNRMASLKRARELLMANKAGAYEAAMAGAGRTNPGALARAYRPGTRSFK